MSVGSLRLTGYRGFNVFEMKGLGRVNLIVGKNNVGKTSVLEALYMLASGSNPSGLLNLLTRRGEQVIPDAIPGQMQVGQADVSHLFYGHSLGAGSQFSVETTNGQRRSVTFRINKAKSDSNPQAFSLFPEEGFLPERLALWVSGEPQFELLPLPLSLTGALRPDVIAPHLAAKAPSAESGSVQFISTESLNVGQVGQMWQSIVLTPAEDRVIRALQIIEPDVERIAQVALAVMQVPNAGFVFPNRGGFFVLSKGSQQRLPIGSYGDGMWRLLALSVALARAKDSILLIDEIDTGLHHTVMEAMWKLIDGAAKDFDVQVFATTHSYDCVQALSSVCRDLSENERNEITIHRVERGKRESIVFAESEIIAAAEREIEIR